MSKKPTVAEFFAGSGLVTEGLRSKFTVVWANDISEKKASHYCSNYAKKSFYLGDISEVSGKDLPETDLVWSSFPCQDLSLAGKMAGMEGDRSGLFWQWLWVIDEMKILPKVICLENVAGLISARGGEDYRAIHEALNDRGYVVGPMLIDAARWLPQSRKRIFIVAVRKELDSQSYQSVAPGWAHPANLVKACRNLPDLVWWDLPAPRNSTKGLSDIIEWDAPIFPKDKLDDLMSLIPTRHKVTMENIAANVDRWVFPGYRRTRNGKQSLELRFDNISGCLRTAEGGSSRQFLLLWREGKWSARLLTSREAARLMGAPDSYQLSDVYNDAYSAMGDAVAVPVVKHLAKHLLAPLASTPYRANSKSESPAFCLQP